MTTKLQNFLLRLYPTFLVFASATLLLVVLFPFASMAQDAGVGELQLPTDPTDFGAWLKLLWGAAMSKNWWLLAAVAVTFIVAALRKWVPENTVVGKFIAGPIGGTICNVVVTWAGAIAAMLLAGQSFSADMVFRAIGISLAAAGTWSVFKNIKQAGSEKAAQADGAAAAKSPGDTLNK